MPGPQELLVIAVVALLVFGPDRLPEMMRTAARLLANFREQSRKSIDELKRAAELDEVNRELRGLQREFRDTASSLQRGVTDSVAAADEAAAGTRGAAGGQAAGDPPPMDPEAT